MTRLTIFAKGNLDVRDSLHAFRTGSDIAWNGINEVLRQRFPHVRVRLRHETSTRSDAMVEATGAVPAALASRSLPLAPYTLDAQFSRALFECDSDAYVLSIQGDVMTAMVRHREQGYLLYPNNWNDWGQEDRRWLESEFMPTPLSDPATAMRNFATIIACIRERSRAPILVYNVSSVVPGEHIHDHAGLDDSLSTRIRRFNVGLVELSQATGVSIIDVDAIVARAGADRVKFDVVHLSAEGCRLIAEEVVRVLDDYGLFEPDE